MPQVIVHIAADGTVKVEAQQVAGPGCQQLTRAIEQALGKTTADVKKPEFVQRTGTVHGAKVGH